MLEIVRKALRITTSDFDDELTSLIDAGIKDLGIAGVVVADETDNLVIQAIVAYCKWRFGQGNKDWQEVFETQKAQLQIATGYTEWRQ